MTTFLLPSQQNDGIDAIDVICKPLLHDFFSEKMLHLLRLDRRVSMGMLTGISKYP